MDDHEEQQHDAGGPAAADAPHDTGPVAADDDSSASADPPEDRTAELEAQVAELTEKLMAALSALETHTALQAALPQNMQDLMDQLATERVAREDAETQLRQLHQRHIAYQRSVADETERHEREVHLLQGELDCVDSILFDKDERSRGAATTGARTERLQSMRAREAGLLSATGQLSKEKERAEAECQSVATELRTLQNEVVWLKRLPFVVCYVRKTEGRKTRDRGPQNLSIGVEHMADNQPATRIELKVPGKKTVRHRFDTVLPPAATAADVCGSVKSAITTAFDGLPVTLMLLSSNSMVSTAGHRTLVMNIANDLWTAAYAGTQEDGWVWSMQLSCVELKADTVRDLLNTDAEYIAVQGALSPQSIRHEVEALRAGPVVTDCANPTAKQADVRRLLDLAIKNRSTSPEGELRGHVAYIFSVTGTKGQFGGAIRGSVTVVDVATDCELPIELPMGASPDDTAVVQAAMETREKERIYVKRSLTTLTQVFQGQAPMYDGMVRVSSKPNERARFYPGDEVEVVGLTAAEFVNLNGTRGMVAHDPKEVKGRIMVDFPGGYSLPFLPRNLVHIRPCGASDRTGTDDSSLGSPTPSRRKRQLRTRDPLSMLLKPSLEHGLLSVVLNLPSKASERATVSALDLCTRISKFQLGPLANQLQRGTR